jgi:hypothetical protein
MRLLYEKLKLKSEESEFDIEDEEEFHMAIYKELDGKASPFEVEKFHEQLDKELGVFKNGEKYDYVKDLKEAYKDSLKTTSEEKIFSSIPQHFFWDIKRPLQKNPGVRLNRYNPFRGREYNSFFDMRDAEEYMER